jgi:5'-methylthioadenosine/S-adenosylhomocysteine nucleosidase
MADLFNHHGSLQQVWYYQRCLRAEYHDLEKIEGKNNMHHIAIIMAMKGEAESLLHRLQLRRQDHVFRSGVPFEVYQGNLKTIRLSLILSGIDPDNHVDNVATVPAALMTYLAIDKFAPDLVVNAGTAGGLAAKGCEIGDVYLSSGKFCFHDRRIPLPGFDLYGMGLYPAWETSDVAHALKLKTGTISTGNSLDLLEQDLLIINQNEAIIKDMEAAAIAWVCRTLSVPLMAVKAITDLIDEETPTETQFIENFNLACDNLHGKTVEILEYLQEKG